MKRKRENITYNTVYCVYTHRERERRSSRLIKEEGNGGTGGSGGSIKEKPEIYR